MMQAPEEVEVMTTASFPSAPQKPRLLDRVRLAMRAHHPAVRDPRTEAVRQQYQRDLSNGHGWVELPGAPERNYPNAGWEWGWHWVFPATSMYPHRESGKRRRHHLHESAVQRSVKEAVRRAGIAKLATPHTLRHYPGCRTMPGRARTGRPSAC